MYTVKKQSANCAAVVLRFFYILKLQSTKILLTLLQHPLSSYLLTVTISLFYFSFYPHQQRNERRQARFGRLTSLTATTVEKSGKSFPATTPRSFTSMPTWYSGRASILRCALVVSLNNFDRALSTSHADGVLDFQREHSLEINLFRTKDKKEKDCSLVPIKTAKSF